MKLTIASIAPTQTRVKNKAVETLFDEYMTRSTRYMPCEAQQFESETALLNGLDRQPGRVAAYAVLLDSRGHQYTSEDFATQLGRLRDEGTQRMVLAIGPADGWSATAKARAQMIFSLGKITLPHQLARVVLAEQVYRALTILAGHPYHSGH
jgi:23S rRNA (pseudouridine1915-N3)-methyltransferase